MPTTIERSFASRLKAARRNIKSKYEIWTLYRLYKDWKNKTKSWRYKHAWYRNYMTWKIKRKERVWLNNPQNNVPGTADWLVETEVKYGGMVRQVPSKKVSSLDPHNSASSLQGGGDRMLHRQYAKHYARFLGRFTQDRNQRVVICEFGILQGTGLAIWCDLFPNARCIGLDIDLSNFEGNRQKLLDLGAFSKNTPELYEYDQFVESRQYLKDILNGDKIDICMDDGHHSDLSIMTTIKSVLPHLNSDFVYFIEDNWEVYKKIESEYQDSTIFSDCELTVVTSFR